MYIVNESKPYYFGLSVGLSLQGISLSNRSDLEDWGESFFVQQDAYQVGLSVGLFSGLRLHKSWELRLLPSLHLGKMNLVYRKGEKLEEQINLPNTHLFLPLQLKWASDRFRNIRPYIAMGPYLSWHFSANRNALVLPRPWAYGVSFSWGCELYMRSVKIIPELSYNYALNEAIRYHRPELPPHRLLYTSLIHRSRGHQINLSLHIQ